MAKNCLFAMVHLTFQIHLPHLLSKGIIYGCYDDKDSFLAASSFDTIYLERQC